MRSRENSNFVYLMRATCGGLHPKSVINDHKLWLSHIKGIYNKQTSIDQILLTLFHNLLKIAYNYLVTTTVNTSKKNPRRYN